MELLVRLHISPTQHSKNWKTQFAKQFQDKKKPKSNTIQSLDNEEAQHLISLNTTTYQRIFYWHWQYLFFVGYFIEDVQMSRFVFLFFFYRLYLSLCWAEGTVHHTPSDCNIITLKILCVVLRFKIYNHFEFLSTWSNASASITIELIPSLSSFVLKDSLTVKLKWSFNPMRYKANFPISCWQRTLWLSWIIKIFGAKTNCTWNQPFVVWLKKRNLNFQKQLRQCGYHRLEVIETLGIHVI